MKTETLITVGNFAKTFPSKENGVGVTPPYIYSLFKKGKNDGWTIVTIAGVNFVQVEGKKVKK